MDTTTNPITAAALAKLKRLYSAATPGEWQYDNAIKVVWPGGIRKVSSAFQMIPCDCIANGNWITAMHNAFPSLNARLEAAERERDTAKAEVARQWITLTEIAELVENYADCDDGDDGIANRPNLAMQVEVIADKATQCNPQAYAWLAARDASMKREGAAEWLENAAKEGGYYERSSEGMLEEAKQLREGK